MKRSIGSEPDMGQQADAAREIPLNGHLLHIKQSHLLPA